MDLCVRVGLWLCLLIVGSIVVSRFRYFFQRKIYDKKLKEEIILVLL